MDRRTAAINSLILFTLSDALLIYVCVCGEILMFLIISLGNENVTYYDYSRTLKLKDTQHRYRERKNMTANNSDYPMDFGSLARETNLFDPESSMTQISAHSNTNTEKCKAFTKNKEREH